MPQFVLCPKPDQLNILLPPFDGGVDQLLPQVGGHDGIIIRVEDQSRCLDLWQVVLCQELYTSCGENLSNILQMENIKQLDNVFNSQAGQLVLQEDNFSSQYLWAIFKRNGTFM